MKVIRCLSTRYLFTRDTKKCRCPVCGESFVQGVKIVVTEEETSTMRGDDIVRFYHEQCYKEPT